MMKDMMNGMIKNEYMDALNKIWTQRRHLPEIQYFLDTEFAWAKNRKRPAVVILGTGIPEELVYACGVRPYWITGGSHALSSWSDELVPRDTDPVSRSILGCIHQPQGIDFSGSLFIIPLVSDSMRKMAYLLRTEGRKIYTVDLPPVREDKNAVERWQRQMLEMTEAISEHVNIHITRDSLIEAVKRVSAARTALVSFLNVSRSRPDIVPDCARLLIQDSYYRIQNIDEWTVRLQVMTLKVSELTQRYAYIGQNRPKVMVMGSPIVFPNYKIPFLINDVDLNLTDAVDSSVLKNYLSYNRNDLMGSRKRIIKNIAKVWFLRDASAAYVKNESMYGYVSWLVSRRNIEGVVYHVLKGQIDQDFELERYEALFSQYGIPVFRLETDYQYQDIEQLRIRLEAFSEMLTQKRYREVKMAK